MSESFPEGQIVEIPEKPHLGRGFVATATNSGAGVMVKVIFPRRDFSTWFHVELLKKVDVIEMLGEISDD